MALPPAVSSTSPTKASLKAWWKQFTFVQRVKKDTQLYNHPLPKLSSGSTVFGIPLRESLRYASVHISTANAAGELYVWGYIPVVVAKCGLYLKEHGTEVQGVFRVSGSNKRMRELQVLFDTPPRYGKDLDWTKTMFTTHDVASVFRRYLTQMPEPIIPHDRYHDFRQVLNRQPPINTQEAIEAYKKLILSLPRPNQYLLLYVLDLLSVFARKSDKNLMTAQNLAVIFRPGVINHPSHEMMPTEHRLSQSVLEFLIAHQDWFMLDLPPPPRSDSILGHTSSPTSSPHNLFNEEDGNWKAQIIGRRRTTIDRGSINKAPSVKVLVGGDTQNGKRGPLETVFKADENGQITPTTIRRSSIGDRIVVDDIALGEGPVTVKRSRTLPSRRDEVVDSKSETVLTEEPDSYVVDPELGKSREHAVATIAAATQPRASISTSPSSSPNASARKRLHNHSSSTDSTSRPGTMESKHHRKS
ncbi:hypothetical protein FRC03_009877 [Tulasnella sp. 419]|nr:hypothetical protein FRC03_009877 [Tulasnella sp. 419]